jgi:hypothetical protein
MIHRETDEDYGKVIAQLGPKNRVIECKDSIQWILQAKVGKRWLSEKFLTSRDGVLRYAEGMPGWEVLKDLPERFQRRAAATFRTDGASK